MKLPTHLKQQLAQFQERVILNISIDFASYFDDIDLHKDDFCKIIDTVGLETL